MPAMQPTRRQFLQCSATLPDKLGAVRKRPSRPRANDTQPQRTGVWMKCSGNSSGRQFPPRGGRSLPERCRTCPASRPVLDRYASLCARLPGQPVLSESRQVPPRFGNPFAPSWRHRFLASPPTRSRLPATPAKGPISSSEESTSSLETTSSSPITTMPRTMRAESRARREVPW